MTEEFTSQAPANGEENESFSIEDLKKELGEYQKLKDEYLAGWQRSRADFLNYKKEEMERIAGFLKYAEEEFVLKILPILDNFEIAEKKILEVLKNDENPEGKPSASYGASVRGILQIKTQILDFLKVWGVEEIKTTVGEKFDPNFHEATEQVEVKEKESGVIVEEIQKGYKINGRLLRPVRVRVVK